jgi:hypothetical protein
MISKKIIICVTALATVACINTSCKKKKGCTDPISIKYDADAEEDDGSCVYAGNGGNTTIVAKPQHHGFPIVSDTVHIDSAFVKYNTQNSPGNTAAAYDLVLPGEPNEDHVHIEGLKPGKYYIMMTGWDTTGTFNGNAIGRVTGGIPYTLTQSAGEVILAVPVTE